MKDCGGNSPSRRVKREPHSLHFRVCPRLHLTGNEVLTHPENDGLESGRFPRHLVPVGSGMAWQAHRDSIVKDQLDRLITEMLDRGLLFEEATKEFEKQFIMKCLEEIGRQSDQDRQSVGNPPQHPAKKASCLQPFQASKKNRFTQKSLDSVRACSYY